MPNRKLVFTDAYIGDWMPKTDGKPFMTAIITFEDEAGQTRYTARVRRWSAEERLGQMRRSARRPRQDDLT